jgi:hypothetical protein
VPYHAAFTDFEETNIAFKIINALIDVFFILDVFVNFRTSYVNSNTGEEIIDLKAIAIQYMKGRFMIDLAASIPFDIFTLIFFNNINNNFTIQMLGLLKLTRVGIKYHGLDLEALKTDYVHEHQE